MISSFIALPFSYIAFKFNGSTDAESQAIQAAQQLFGTILFIVLTRYMKRLLNEHCLFHEVNRQIDLMIMANVGAGVLVLLGLLYTPLKDTLEIAAIVVMVLLGIVQIQFGYRLQKMENNLGGLLKPFCYTNIATGICIASVVLLIVGVVVSAVSDLMLGTIFFNIAKLVEKPEENLIDG